MLRELRVQSLGVIEDITIELADGLTVVTGETGVGKTLIVTGLSLLCGARGDSTLIRDGADGAAIEALVRGVDEDVVVARRMTGSGNRIRVAGELGTVADLREWATGRIEIHGQHDHIRLADPAVQRNLLDHFAGAAHLEELASHRQTFDARTAALAERDVLVGDGRIRLRLADQLRHELAEIEGVAIDVEADEALDDRLELLEAGEQVRHALAAAALALGDEGAADALGAAVGALRDVPATATMAAFMDRAVRLVEEATDLARELRDAAEDAEVDPGELDALRERVRVLAGLRRKYGDGLADVLAHADDARVRLAELDGTDDRLADLDRNIAELDDQLDASRQTLFAARRKAADDLVPTVTAQLRQLGMPHAHLDITIDEGGAPRDGGHEVTFRVGVNPGQPAVTLGKGASGGERSRIALAIETALADADRTTTIVFDEVDAGVGGDTARAVGAALARLAHARPDRQVLCVTHLAQVAAHADVHHVVDKHVEAGATVTTARRLSEDERPAELARMMGGADTDAGLAHGLELLAVARAAATTSLAERNRQRRRHLHRLAVQPRRACDHLAGPGSRRG
ncbi:MAG: DNA repair protein RecN [Nitriliruptorales bacterium]|nr:DNA repair protein RecN [Nitriliruptorales bacterium]